MPTAPNQKLGTAKMQETLQEDLSSSRKPKQLIAQGEARRTLGLVVGRRMPPGCTLGLVVRCAGSPSPGQGGCHRANGSGAGPACPALRLRTSVPGHGRCGCRVLELSAFYRSQPLPSAVCTGWAQALGRRRSAEEAEAAIGRRRSGRMASILLRSCRGRGPACLAPPRASSPRGKPEPRTRPVVQAPTQDPPSLPVPRGSAAMTSTGRVCAT